MTRFFVILLAASFALTAVAAVAENATGESRARLAATWENERADATSTTASSGPVAAASRTNVTGIGERRHGHLSGHWSGNYAGGRKHPPAGH